MKNNHHLLSISDGNAVSLKKKLAISTHSHNAPKELSSADSPLTERRFLASARR